MGYTGKLKKSALYIGTEEDNSELLPGTEGQILSVDSSGNLVWIDPPSGSGMVLIETKNPSTAASFDFLGIPEYNNYLLIIESLQTINQTSENDLFLSFTRTGGSTYGASGSLIYTNGDLMDDTPHAYKNTGGGLISNEIAADSYTFNYRAQIFITRMSSVSFYSGSYSRDGFRSDTNRYTGNFRGTGHAFTTPWTTQNGIQIKARTGNITLPPVGGGISLYGIPSS